MGSLLLRSAGLQLYLASLWPNQDRRRSRGDRNFESNPTLFIDLYLYYERSHGFKTGKSSSSSSSKDEYSLIGLKVDKKPKKIGREEE